MCCANEIKTAGTNPIQKKLKMHEYDFNDLKIVK